jgi:hypothetical protein
MRLNNMTKADFVWDDQPMTAFFDETGEFVASTTPLNLLRCQEHCAQLLMLKCRCKNPIRSSK